MANNVFIRSLKEIVKFTCAGGFTVVDGVGAYDKEHHISVGLTDTEKSTQISEYLRYLAKHHFDKEGNEIKTSPLEDLDGYVLINGKKVPLDSSKIK